MARTSSTKVAIVQALDGAAVPIYIVDDKRRIIYCNPACLQWTEAEAQQLVGARCDYHSGPPGTGSTTPANVLCPPPEVFAGRRMTARVTYRTSAGQLKCRRAEFVPLGRDAAECTGVIVVLDAEDLSAPELEQTPTEAEALTLHQRVQLHRQQICRPYRTEQLIGDSPAIRRARDQVELAIAGRPRVLVVGPPGSGREHLARTIHYHETPESAPPLVPLSCSLLDAELLQTTVDAFVRSCAELATERPAALLLLEVDQLEPDAQAALLGFLTIPELDLHTIATARQPLMELAQSDKFRSDLASALSTLVITLPPLCRRPADIPLLAQVFVEQQNAAGGRQIGGFTPDALDQLAAYPWPQNIDELRQMVGQAHKQAGGSLIAVGDLPERIRLAADAAAYERPEEETIVLDEFLGRIEAELLSRALRRAKGNKTKAAKLLGINRARLLRRINQLKLDEESS